jgi:hypothetical protein
VFTLPSKLNLFALRNKEAFYVFSPVRHPKIVSFGLTTSDKATVDENS